MLIESNLYCIPPFRSFKLFTVLSLPEALVFYCHLLDDWLQVMKFNNGWKPEFPSPIPRFKLYKAILDELSRERLEQILYFSFKKYLT